MAIQFITEISEYKTLMAYNNNIIEFYTDEAVKVVLKATIFFGGQSINIYANSLGKFYFNFREYVTTLVNQTNFVDNINPELDASDIDTFSYNWNAFYTDVATIRISFTDNSYEDAQRTLSFLPAVEQLDGYKRNEVQTNDNIILSPLVPQTNNHYYVKYWEGYQFDVSFLQKDYPMQNEIALTNNTNLLDYTFNQVGKVTRLFFCDGSTDESINDLLPIALGENEIAFADKFIIVDKQDVCKGLYIKWVNQYGGYSYWLFDNIYKKQQSAKSIGEINTDFNNLESTFSQVSDLGKLAGQKINVNTDTLNEREFSLLQSLLSTPKAYLFIGEPFAMASVNDWVEVKITTTNYTVRNYKGQPVRLSFDLELPDLYTQTL